MVKLIDFKRPPNKAVIKYLEERLSEAKNGETQTIAIVIQHSDRKTSSGWSGLLRNPLVLIGEIEVLKRDMMDSSVDLYIDPETGERDE